MSDAVRMPGLPPPPRHSVPSIATRFEAFNLDPALAEAAEAAPEQVIEGILRLERAEPIPPEFTVVARFERICTGRFLAAHVWTIRSHANVMSLKASRALGNADDAGPLADLLQPATGTPARESTPSTGRGAIVAALDFGVDFAHPNFLAPDGRTRLLALWHQGAPYDPARPNAYGYGRVFWREEIDAALRTPDPYQALGYHPATSDTGSGSHGTHTLDIAAGNGRARGARASAAPGTDLIFVHLSTPRLGAVGDLGDSVRLLEGLHFVNETARGRPWVVNLSVGRTAGSHDGTSLVEQGMHELLRLGPGRAIVQSAGNYRAAHLAVQGWLRDGEHRDLQWVIDPRDTTANEIDAWYSGKDRFVAAIRPPGGTAFLHVELGQVADVTHAGALVGRIYHRRNDPNNRDNHVEVFLYPGAPSGRWTVRLIGDYVIHGRFHAWIERDLARPGAQSRFDPDITTQSYTLGTIATSPLVITVGAYDANADGTPLAPFSSCGPTRDERRDKPELLAPGVDVVAARSIPRSASRQEGLLVARSGTSMAAPHVTSAVAALYEAAGRPLTIFEIRECLRRSAAPLTDTDHGDCGTWGRLNTEEAIRIVNTPDSPAEEATLEALTAEVQGTPGALSIVVVDERGRPMVEGAYAAYQGTQTERGRFASAGNGLAQFQRIDPARPFAFEVGDRVCAIRLGAFIDPDDPAIEYGGTRVDWTLVRDDNSPDTAFWPHYQREMDFSAQAEAAETTLGRRVDRFVQHEHITRRPIRIAKAFLTPGRQIRLCAVPVRLRVGPIVRYTDHERAVIWLETVTPAMVRVRYRRAAGGDESSRCASTVRVGGRHFAAVELVRLSQETFYDYTVELAPLPASGAIPTEPEAVAAVFPQLTASVKASIKGQLATASLSRTEWLTFRTLRAKYDTHLRFATGSCRWYPGDKKDGKDYGPDMLAGLGDWLVLHANRRDQWPSFLFFGGDQIYADEIGDDHGEMLIQGRFAARIPGPVDPAPVRGRLIDGAWAGRFAHRYKVYKDPTTGVVERVTAELKELDQLAARYPEIPHFYHRYPKTGITDKESRVLASRLMSGLTWGLGGKVTDQKTYDKALELLRRVDQLNFRSGSFRAFLPHWRAGFSPAIRRNPMGHRLLSHNFLLWEIPNFEALQPTVVDSANVAMVQPNLRGHLAAAGGRHAADFAEYAYLYERAWTGSRSVSVLLAQIPTFLMLDDHEATDDWNVDVGWVRMLHNDNDALQMWPKTLTDGLAAYWMYQGWCNKAPSHWSAADPRIKALADAQQRGADALPELRKCIYHACFMDVPSKPPTNPREQEREFQTGLKLDWHYKLPFEPPFLVPDCRTRRCMVPGDDVLRIIDHDDPRRPLSQTIDDAQLAWMRSILLAPRRDGPVVAFIAPSTPLLLQKKVMDIMMKPETAAEAWEQLNLPSIVAAASGSAVLGTAADSLLRVFRRNTDLEHMIRDKSWRDLWGLVEAMRTAGSRVKTLVLVSGDVHHNYCMTANLSGRGRPQPEMLQITCSGLQTTIRSSTDRGIAEDLGNAAFNIGKYRLVPGFMFKTGSRVPDLALFENAVALVDVTMASEVNVRVSYLAGRDTHTYLYTSGPAYMRDGEPTDSPWQKGRPRLVLRSPDAGESATEIATEEDPPATASATLPSARVPKVMFEFDVHYGFRDLVDDKLGQSVPFDRLTKHDKRHDFFNVKRDIDRLEIGTERFTLDATGLADIDQVKIKIKTFADQLEQGCRGAAPRRDITIPGISGHPRLFPLPNAKSSLSHLQVHKLHINGKFPAGPGECGVWASPQAHITIPLSQVGRLIEEIRSSIGKPQGIALTGGSTLRMGVRSDHLYRAKQGVESLRKAMLTWNHKLSNGVTVDGATFSEQLSGFLMLQVSYLWAVKLRQRADTEFFGKGHLPINVKTPFPEIFSQILTPTEQLIYKELFAGPTIRYRMFGLVEDRATLAAGSNKLFPPDVVTSSLTWDSLLDWTLALPNAVVGLPGGGTVWPASETAPLVTLELRRIGFRAMGAEHWATLIDTIVDLTKRLN